MLMYHSNNPFYRKEAYESPFVEVVDVLPVMTVCASNGETENYGQLDPWDIPDND